MSNKIDERIVEMSFDNKRFEKGISESQKSLSDFKHSLDFKEQERSLDSFASSMTRMGAVTFSIINNLTNKVVDFGLALTKSLTIDPIMDGMNDYNTKLTTMQTITNATGKSIAEVETYFGQLDEYADKTIYNLTDMTSSMSKFVNAGVGLDQAVPAIKGIANMTALAGQDANAASIAMYNLSQSIAGGFLTTMDYKSLNLANVATIEWKNTMIDAAVASGKLKKSTDGYITPAGKAYNAAQLFTEGLKDQWATTDVLLKVLGDYGDTSTAIGKKAQAAAQDVKSFGMMMETLKAAIGTGWTRSFEAIIGNLEESKKLWTGMTNGISAFIDRVSDARNEMLEFWKAQGGRDAFIAGMKNVAVALLKVILAISKAFDQIFPPKTKQEFVDMFKNFESFTKLLILGEDQIDKIKRTFAGFFAVIDIFAQSLKFIGSVFGQVIKEFFPGFGGGLLGITANLGDFLVAIHDVVETGGYFQKMLAKTGLTIHQVKIYAEYAVYAIVGLIQSLRDGSITFDDIGGVIVQVLNGIKNFIAGLLKGKGVVASFNDAFSNITMTLDGAKDGVEGFGDIFVSNMGKIREFVSLVGSKLLPMFEWIHEALSKVSLQQIVAIAVGVGLIKLAKTLLGVVNPLSSIAEAFTGVLTSLSGAIKGLTLNMKAEALFTLAKAIALIAISLIALTMVPIEKLAQSLGILSIMMAELVISMLLLNKIKNPAKIGMQLMSLSMGLLVIAFAAKQFDDMSWEGLAKAGVAIAGFMAIVLIFSKVMGTSTIVAAGMMTLSLGLLAMTAAIKILSDIDSAALIKGTAAITGLLTVLVIYANLTRGVDFAKASGGMIAFGIGLLALTAALFILSKLSFETLARGGIALLGLLTVLALYSRMAGSADLKKSTAGMIGLGIGLLAITAALTVLGKLPFTTLLQGSVALLALLATLALFVNMTNGKDLSVSGMALIGLGVGLIALSGALAILGSLDFSTLLQGGIALTALLAVLAAFVNLTSGKDLAVTATSMIAFAGGIAMLAGVIAILTLLDTGKMLAATLAISGLVIAVGAFSKLTNIGSLLGSAVGLVAFALALAALSIPIKMIAEIPWQQLAGTALVIVAAVGAFALIAALMPVFAAVGPLIPPALLGVLGVALIIAEIGLLVAAFGALANIPGAKELVQGGGDLLLEIGLAIGKFLGGIIGGAIEGVTAGLPGMAKNLSDFGIALQPFFAAISGVDSSSVEAVKYLAETLLILGAAQVVDAMTSWLTGGTSLVDFAAELKAFAPPFVEFANVLKSGNIDADVITNAANAALAMSEMANKLPNAGGLAAVFAGENTLSSFATELAAFAQPFVDFATTLKNGNIDASVIKVAADAASTMSVMASKLPNQGGYAAVWAGDNTLSMFAAELAAFAPNFVQFASVLNAADIRPDVIQTAANAASTMAVIAKNLPNQGGYAAVWAGDNTLSMFAAELAAFAPNFVSFVQTLSTVTVSEAQVTTAANAAMMMAELANNLPNQGGMVAWFTGDNTLSAFADELVKFAPKFVQFVNQFEGIKATTVTPGIEALNLLVNTMQLNGKEAMNNLSKGFEDNKPSTIQKIKNVIEDVVRSIDGYQSKFVKSGEYIVDGLVKGMNNKMGSVRAKAKEIAQSVLTTVDNTLGIHSPAKELIEKGKFTTQGFINGITSKKDELVGSVTNMANSASQAFGKTADGSSFTKGIEDLIGSLTSSFETGGTEAANSFGAGLSSSASGSNFSNALNSFSEKSGKAGKAATEKMKSAFEQFKDWLSEEKFYARIDTTGEIEAWEKQQKLYKQGSEERKEIDRELYTLRNKLVDETYQNEMSAIEEKKFYNQLTSAEELALLEEMQKKYAEGSEQRKKIDRDVYTLRNKLVDESYQKEKANIDELNYYNQLSLEEELGLLKQMQNEYEEGSEQRKKIDREIYALEKKIYETQLQYIEDVTAAQKDADDKRLQAQQKYDEAVSKASENAADKTADAQKKRDEAIDKAQKDAEKRRTDAQEKYHDTTTKASEDAAKKTATAQKKYDSTVEKAHEDAAKKAADAQKKYNAQLIKLAEDENKKRVDLEKSAANDIAKIHDQLLKDVEAAEKRYTDAVKQRADTIYGYFGLFDKVGEREVFTADELLQNLVAQNAELEDWRSSLEMLESRGVSQGLLQELQDLGVSSNGQLKALVSMTDEQLAEFSTLFERKHEIANFRALNELKGYREEVNREITAMHEQADRDTEARIAEFNASLLELEAEVRQSLAEAAQELNDTLTEVNSTLQEKLSEARTEFSESMSEINRTLNDAMSQASADLSNSMNEINANLSESLAQAKSTFNESMSSINKELSDAMNDAKKTLNDSMTSINKDLSDKLSSLEKSFNKTMETVHDKSAKEYAEMNKDLKKSLETLNKDTEEQLKTLETTSTTKTANAAKAMSDNVKTGVNDSKQALEELNMNINSIFAGFEQALYSIGIQGAQGLAQGLRSGEYSVYDAGRSLGEAALNAARQALDVHSPSREMFDVGMFADKGLAGGLLRYLGVVTDAGEQVGDASIDALTKSLSGLANLDFDEINTSPVITPVLDLSQIRLGAQALDSLFGESKSFALAAQTRNNAAKAAADQNGSKLADQPQPIINQFDCTGMVVREEADIDRIAEKLYKKQQMSLRGKGGRNLIPVT